VTTKPRTSYVRPTGDAPLDAVEQALVRMWVDIIAARIRARLAREQIEQDAADKTNGPASAEQSDQR
jgi:hypothetical protein